MSWRPRYSAKAEKQLSRLDSQQSRIIVAWLMKNVNDCEDPRMLGGPLTADLKGEWRYRIGGYRALVEIENDSLVVLALQIGHRRGIYSKQGSRSRDLVIIERFSVEIHLFAHSGRFLSGKGWRSWVYARRKAR